MRSGAARAGRISGRHSQRVARQRGDFPRDADDTVEVGTVGGDFEVIQHIGGGAAEIFRERLAYPGVLAQDQEAVNRAGETKFLGRTHHSLADDAEDLAFFDDEGLLLARLQGQRVVGQDERDFVAHLVILRTANDGALGPAVIDFADRELVRAGHFVPGEDLGDDDAFEFAGEPLHPFDFEPEHRESLGQFLRRPIEINVLFEPVERDFHRAASF